MQRLIARRNHSDELPEEKKLSDYNDAINIELNALKDYDIDKFKDLKLHSLYTEYKKELENGLHIIETTKSTSDLYRDWYKHTEKRGIILKNYQTNMS